MEKKLTELEKGEKYFFYVDKNGGCSAESFVFELTEKVDKEVLRKAAQKTVSCYPLFGMRPVVDQEGSLYLTENDLPVEIGESGGKTKYLGTEETNGYLFRIICDGNVLRIHAHHSLGDGRTVLSFGMTLIYYYLILSGVPVDPEGKLYTEEDLGEPTLLNSFLKDVKAVETGEPHGAYLPEQVFSFPDEKKEEKAEEDLYLVSWPSQEMIRYTREHQVKPTAFIAAVIGSVIHTLFPVGNQHIVFGFPVDMRTRMKSRSQRNYIGNIRLPYYPQYRNLDFDEQTKRLKADMDVQMDASNIIPRVKALETVIDAMMQEPLLAKDHHQAAPDSPRKREGAVAQTILLTNIGRLAVPEAMTPFIADVRSFASAQGGKAAAGLLTVGERGTLFVGQETYGKELAEAVCRLLQEKGIHASCEKMDQAVEEVRMDVKRFMTIEEMEAGCP